MSQLSYGDFLATMSSSGHLSNAIPEEDISEVVYFAKVCYVYQPVSSLYWIVDTPDFTEEFEFLPDAIKCLYEKHYLINVATES